MSRTRHIDANRPRFDAIVSALPPAVEFTPPPLLVGVYLLTLGAEVVYVGQAEDIEGRLCTHFRDRDKVFDSARYHLIPLGELDAAEQALIARYAPRYNVKPGGNGNGPWSAVALAGDVGTAVGFLTETDEDGIPARDLYRRVQSRTGSGMPKRLFHRAMDSDPRVRHFPSEGVYRLALPAS